MKRMFFVSLLCLLPALASAGTRTMQVSWSYDPPVPTDLAGFNLYVDGEKSAAITDPVARTWTGEMTVKDESACYTMTAVDSAGVESPKSPCFDFNLPPGTPGNVTVRVVVDVKVQVPAE